jgi:hypothetical protein
MPPQNERERQLFADGMYCVLNMVRSKSLVFMPYGSISCFISCIEENDPTAMWYVEKLYDKSQQWPPDRDETAPVSEDSD